VLCTAMLTCDLYVHSSKRRLPLDSHFISLTLLAGPGPFRDDESRSSGQAYLQTVWPEVSRQSATGQYTESVEEGDSVRVTP